jgi:transposase
MYDRENKRKPKKHFKPRQKGRILQVIRRLNAKSQRITTRKIKTNCDIDLSKRTVKRELKSLNLTYKKEKKVRPGATPQ